MQHEAHVGLVDAHAKGDGGDDDRRFVVGEAALVGGARGRVQPGVVGQGVPAVGDELLRQRVHRLAGHAVDDARLVAVVLQEGQCLPQAIHPRRHVQEEVLAVEAGDEHGRVGDAQRVADVGPYALGGRGRDCQADRAGEAPPHRGQLAILRPEVMTPFGDAVGLVNGQAVDAAAVEQGQRLRPQQRLRRGVEQLHLAGGHAVANAHVLVIGQGAVEVGCGRAQLAQLHHLVFHQRDERRDDDGQAGGDQRRQLVAQRLAAAGGHDGQTIALSQHVGDDLRLQRPELVIAEDALQHGPRLAHLLAPWESPLALRERVRERVFACALP